MPFVVKKQSNQTTESTKDTKMKTSENFVTFVPFVVKKRTPSPATSIMLKSLSSVRKKLNRESRERTRKNKIF
jgi:hypothetical protein